MIRHFFIVHMNFLNIAVGLEATIFDLLIDNFSFLSETQYAEKILLEASTQGNQNFAFYIDLE